MTLVERSAVFAKAASELDSLRAAADLVQAVTSRATQLEQALARLRLAAGRMRILSGHGLELDVDVSPAAGIAHYLREFKAAVQANPAAATAGDLTPKTVTPINRLAETLDVATSRVWAAHVRAQLPQVGTDLLDLLVRVPGLKPRVEEFRQLLQQALQLAATVPTGDAGFERLDELADRCTTAWRDLDAESLPPSVTRFLREATSPAGAPLDALKPDVMAWLSQHGLLHSFGIKTR